MVYQNNVQKTKADAEPIVIPVCMSEYKELLKSSFKIVQIEDYFRTNKYHFDTDVLEAILGGRDDG